MSPNTLEPREPATNLATRLGLTLPHLLSLPGLLGPDSLPQLPRPGATSCWPGLPARPATPPKARPALDLGL